MGKHMSEWRELREDGAIDELDHRMDDALRVDDDVDPGHLDIEEPARLDHLQPLVEERGGIDGDLLAHVPCGMPERLLRA